MMDAEEEHIRSRIEEREKALKQKVNLLKDRIEQMKKMADVKAIVYRRPALMVAGSVLTGFVLKKMTSRRHAGNGSYRSAARKGAYNSDTHDTPRTRSSTKFRDALVAVITGVASRAATNILSDLSKQIIPGKYDVRRAERNFRGTHYNP